MNSSEEIQNHDVNAGSATSVHEKDRVILKTVVGLLFVVPMALNLLGMIALFAGPLTGITFELFGIARTYSRSHNHQVAYTSHFFLLFLISLIVYAHHFLKRSLSKKEDQTNVQTEMQKEMNNSEKNDDANAESRKTSAQKKDKSFLKIISTTIVQGLLVTIAIFAGPLTGFTFELFGVSYEYSRYGEVPGVCEVILSIYLVRDFLYVSIFALAARLERM